MASNSGERVDRYLVRLGFAPSRREARDMVEGGAVRINGRRCRKGELVTPSDKVEIADGPRRAVLEPNPTLGVEVLYEDAAVIVVNKPGTMPCHPLRHGERDTVMNAVVARFPETAHAGDKEIEGGLVHRLDNGTSGALIVARTRDAFDIMRRAIRSGRIKRRYRALIAGALDHPIDLATPIAHHPKNPRKMVPGDFGSANPRRAGRRAVSHVEPERKIGAFTLVTVTPETGSRHQIRVHLASAGHPLVGDKLYGGPETPALSAGRFWLHLAELDFDSPAAGRIKVRAPIPDDLRALLD